MTYHCPRVWIYPPFKTISVIYHVSIINEEKWSPSFLIIIPIAPLEQTYTILKCSELLLLFGQWFEHQKYARHWGSSCQSYHLVESKTYLKPQAKYHLLPRLLVAKCLALEPKCILYSWYLGKQILIMGWNPPARSVCFLVTFANQTWQWKIPICRLASK